MEIRSFGSQISHIDGSNWEWLSYRTNQFLVVEGDFSPMGLLTRNSLALKYQDHQVLTHA